ncbi:hypothetical protein [Burkholderia contaminans]|uniref:hypothetical protein n=1 Tax=Burkholderia contaminans TaxID=488447 RepID=UPI00158F0F3D|nr:hypothetical protein [Burkholderia contaminans]
MKYEQYKFGVSKNLMVNYTVSKLLEEGLATDLDGNELHDAAQTIYFAFIASGAENDELHEAYLNMNHGDIATVQKTINLL